VGALAFGESGDLLAAADDYGNVYLWNVAKRTVLGALRGTPAIAATYSQSIAFSPDGRLLAVSFRNGSTGVWSLAAGDRLADLQGGQTLLDGAVAFGLGGSLLVTMNDSGGITEWTLS